MIAYLLQLTIVWGVLYAFYYLFLRKLTFFTANRFFLLASLVLGLWLPTLDIDWGYWLPLSAGSATPTYLPTIPVDWQQLDRPAASAEAVMVPSALPSSSSPLPDWPWYYYVYLLGATLAVIRLVAGLWQMQHLYLEGKRHYARDYVRIDHEAVPTPFSFFRYIFWSPRIDHRTTDGQRILQHERAHGRLGHSWDIVLIETLQILGWFHPLLFLYRRSLQQIHEYQADAAVLRETAVRTYGTMLLRQAQGKGQPAFLAHPFSNTQLKNRILMMTRTRSRYHQLWRFALAVPLLLLLMVGFSNPGLSQENQSNGEELFMIVEDMPLFPGTSTKEESEKAIFQFIARNIKYPKVAREAGIQGTNVVQFVVRKDGSIDEVSLLRDVGAGTGEEAIRVIENLPEGWKPGIQRGQKVNVQYRIPIQFKLPDGADGYGHIIVDDGKEYEPALFPGTSTLEETDSAIFFFYGPKLKYPKLAQNNGVKGIVMVQFTIRKDGTPDEFKVIRDIGAGAGEAAVEVLRQMPKWTPALKNGQPVEAKYHYGIHFRIQKYSNGENQGVFTRGPLIDVAELKKQNQASAKKPLDGEEVFMLVEDMPLFPGTTTKEESDKAVFDHVARNIKYPKVAREKGVTGTNVVQFIVRKDGSISDIEVIRNIGAGTGEESIRVVESMPDGWKPGKQRGRAVNVQFRLPIRFKATDEHVSQIAIDEPQKEPVPEPKAVDTEEPKDQIFMTVEQMPLFNGTTTKKESDKSFFEFIGQNLRYPKVAKENGVEGTVIAQFVIRKDGSVSDVTLLRDIGAGAGEEAMRVIEDMPNWVPGKQKGNPVNVQFRVPVRFKLAEEVATPPQEIDVNQINNTLSDDALTIFPNPSDGRVELRFKEPLAAGDVIRLYNANGQFLRTESLGDQTGSISRAMTIAQPGTYYLQLVKGTKMLTKTVIIQ